MLARWMLVVGAVTGIGCDSKLAGPNGSLAAGFDRVWSAFDDTYPYFGLKQINWALARTTYRPRAADAESTAGLNDVLLEMLAPLRDLHVVLESPTGDRIPSYRPVVRTNWDRTQWLAEIGSAGWVQVKPGLGRGRIDGIPYIAIGSWNASQFTVADLDATLEPYRTDTSIVVDVRPNGGGDDWLALEFARRFTSMPVLTEIVKYRTGPGPNDLGKEVRRTITPRGPWTFAGRVYLLIGRGVYSSNESFVSAMRELPNSVLVGDTTGGATANPRPIKYHDGWKVWVSTWYASTPDGIAIEGHGIPPDLYVPWSAGGGRDPIVAAAVRLARGQR